MIIPRVILHKAKKSKLKAHRVSPGKKQQILKRNESTTPTEKKRLQNVI